VRVPREQDCLEEDRRYAEARDGPTPSLRSVRPDANRCVKPQTRVDFATPR
jgi:hypothetical protein